MKRSNQRCTVEFDARGRVCSLENLRTGETYPVSEGAEYAIFDGERVDDPAAFRVEWTDRGEYFEKTVYFTAPRDGVLDQLCAFDPAFPGASEVHYHEDKSIWHVPMCVYARYEKGGAYYGLEYPYWDDETKMVFSPWLPMKKGEEFASEKVFLGTFRRTGKTVTSYGPYPCGGKQKYKDMFWPENGGFNQQVPDFKIPEDMGFPAEVLDRGEIRAMRDFFRIHLGKLPLAEDGYFVFQSSWWARLWNADTSIIDTLLESGVHDMFTAPIYFGHANHPITEPPYITDVLFDPLRFPKVDFNALPRMEMPEQLHHIETVGEKPEGLEYTNEFCAPLDFDQMIRYGKERGFHVTSFSTPNNAYRAYPEWVQVGPGGKPYDYFGSKFSCPACKEYMDRHFQVICALMEKYQPRMWSFDGRWMGYREFDYGQPMGEQPCYADNHGHLPGKSRYIEWRNIREFKRQLRERFPRLMMEHYYGVKRGSTWSLEFFNSDENYYECSCADDNRLQTWHNENDRFRPTYMNYAQIFGTELHDFRYSLISAISTSEYAQLANGFFNLRDNPEDREFFKKWHAWAGENHKYLQDRETLFGCPGDVPVDGSAHIIDGEGWVFLFNTVDFDDTAKLDLADIPGLDGADYEAKVIYPDERVIPAKDGFIDVPVPSHSACVLWLGKR